MCPSKEKNNNNNFPKSYFCDGAGEIRVGATLRFLLFGCSSDSVSVDGSDDDVSNSLFNATDVGVSGGVPNGAADPVDEIDGFRFNTGCDEVTTVGWTNVDVGGGADRAAGGTCDILEVVEAKPDKVATEEEEFDRVGLDARADGVGKDGFEVVEGDGRECDPEEEIVVGAGPGWISPNSPGSKMIVEQNPSVDVIINILPSDDLLSVLTIR